MKQKDVPIILPRNYIVWCLFIWLVFQAYRTPKAELIATVYFVVAGFILCEIYISYIRTQISIQVEPMTTRLNKDEKATLKLTVFNHSFLPAPYIYLFLKESYHVVPEEIKCLCVTLPPHSHKEYTFNLKAVNSGVETVGIEKVIINDFMELARRKLKFKHEQEIVVLPQPVSFKGGSYMFNYMPDNTEDEKNNKHYMVTDEGEVSYELKPYNEGESQRLMHWKLVAQRDIYMVRQREQIIKLRREQLVVIDPVVTTVKLKPDILQRFIKTSRIRLRWEQGEKDARLRDKLVNGTTSYLLRILEKGEGILLLYYEDNKWQQVTLKTIQDLEKISEKISKSMLTENVKPSERWPEIPDKDYAQKILISARVDNDLKEIIMNQSGIKVFELQKRSIVDDDQNTYWYLTDDYKIVKNE